MLAMLTSVSVGSVNSSELELAMLMLTSDSNVNVS